MTVSAAQRITTLRRTLHSARTVHGRRSRQAAEAFNALFRYAASNGQPIDGLRIHSPVESERFFARTVQGPDGHVYWVGGKQFRLNNRKVVSPRRWWWAHLHGEITRWDDVVPMCGDKTCVNPEHCQVGRDILRPRKFSDEQMLNGLKALALDLGHTPSSREWEAAGRHPSFSLFKMRFGGWPQAVAKAGLVPVDPELRRHKFPSHDEAELYSALRFVWEQVGHPPSQREYLRFKDELAARGWPITPDTFRHRLGSWKVAQHRVAALIAADSRS